MDRRPVVGGVKTCVTWLPDGSMVMIISWMVGLVSEVAKHPRSKIPATSVLVICDVVESVLDKNSSVKHQD